MNRRGGAQRQDSLSASLCLSLGSALPLFLAGFLLLVLLLPSGGAADVEVEYFFPAAAFAVAAREHSISLARYYS